MDFLALHGHEGLKYTKGVKDVAQVLGLLLIFE